MEIPIQPFHPFPKPIFSSLPRSITTILLSGIAQKKLLGQLTWTSRIDFFILFLPYVHHALSTLCLLQTYQNQAYVS